MVRRVSPAIALLPCANFSDTPRQSILTSFLESLQYQAESADS
ncbi:hypothetical protein SBV1_990003 [Verrucomicrobia bacterium]|nr:hypothetical protein SBV1_990003 [Verrucomicrobiota bacterium]